MGKGGYLFSIVYEMHGINKWMDRNHSYTRPYSPVIIQRKAKAMEVRHSGLCVFIELDE